MNNPDLLNLIFGVATFLLLGLVVMWLWNTTLPDLFSVKKITFLQALKVLALSLILTGGLSLLGINGGIETHTVKLNLPR
jgi:cell division septal protein FtsQ